MPDVLKIERFPEHPIWGDCVFLEAQTDDAEAVRTAYAEGSPAWPLLHFAVSGPSAHELDPWYRLGFAQMHAYGARPSGGDVFDVPGVALRPGGPADLETAIRLDLLIEQAQRETPSYSSFTHDMREHRATCVETLEGADVTYVIAERDDIPVGHVTLYPDPTHSDALHLASTAVVPEERGRGVGRALTAFALAHAEERGFANLRTNWRVTNLVASRYWPARGFELTHLRLVRRLPEL
jgi:ribosomal protein S18 acetylase RimI-like enzyme